MSFFSSPYKKEIIIDHTKVGGALTNFPMYIDLSTLGDDFWGFVKNGGGDIRITDSKRIECPREVVSCNTTAKTGEVWALIPTVSATIDTTIYIYFGNASLGEPAANATYGSQNVWGSTAKYIGHYDTAATDSSSSANVPANTGTPTYVAGKLGGGAIAFNGIDQGLNFASVTPVEHTGTIDLWVNLQGDGVADPGGTITIFQSNLDTRTRLFYANSNDRIIFVKGSSSTNSTQFLLTVGVWTKVTCTWIPINATNGTMVFYVNGNLISTNTYTDTTTAGTNPRLRIGDFNASNPQGGWWNGYVDEFKVWNVVKTQAYITTEYNNQSSPSTFYRTTTATRGWSGGVPKLRTSNLRIYRNGQWRSVTPQLDGKPVRMKIYRDAWIDV